MVPLDLLPRHKRSSSSSVAPPRRTPAQSVVSVDNEETMSVVDPTAFAAALALERDGQEKVCIGTIFLRAMGSV